VVEGKGVPGEPPGRTERSGDALKGAAAVGPGWQVQEGAEPAIDEGGGLLKDEVAHVALAQPPAPARAATCPSATAQI